VLGRPMFPIGNQTAGSGGEMLSLSRGLLRGQSGDSARLHDARCMSHDVLLGMFKTIGAATVWILVK
jgi:hypothetical protein